MTMTATATTTGTFYDALATFLSTTQARLDAEYAANYEHVKAPTLSAEFGRKNVRIVASGPGSRYVYCFVRIADGAVMKADGWKRPAKHARGSIYVGAGQDAITTYGAKYLR